MKRILLSLIAALAISISSQAEGYRAVIISIEGAGSTHVKLSDNLTFKYLNENLKVTDTAQGIKLSIPAAAITSFRLTDESSIAEVDTEANDWTFAQDLAVGIFNTAGQNLRSFILPAGEQLPMTDLPAGTYVITIGKTAIKISK